jgi:hypothetical protein
LPLLPHVVVLRDAPMVGAAARTLDATRADEPRKTAAPRAAARLRTGADATAVVRASTDRGTARTEVPVTACMASRLVKCDQNNIIHPRHSG